MTAETTAATPGTERVPYTELILNHRDHIQTPEMLYHIAVVREADLREKVLATPRTRIKERLALECNQLEQMSGILRTRDGLERLQSELKEFEEAVERGDVWSLVLRKDYH